MNTFLRIQKKATSEDDSIRMGSQSDSRQTEVSGALASIESLLINALSVIRDPQPKPPPFIVDFHFDSSRLCVAEGLSRMLSSARSRSTRELRAPAKGRRRHPVMFGRTMNQPKNRTRILFTALRISTRCEGTCRRRQCKAWSRADRGFTQILDTVFRQLLEQGVSDSVAS